MDWVLRDEIRRIVREGLRGVAPRAVRAVELEEEVRQRRWALEVTFEARYGMAAQSSKSFTAITGVV